MSGIRGEVLAALKSHPIADCWITRLKCIDQFPLIGMDMGTEPERHLDPNRVGGEGWGGEKEIAVIEVHQIPRRRSGSV